MYNLRLLIKRKRKKKKKKRKNDKIAQKVIKR